MSASLIGVGCHTHAEDECGVTVLSTAANPKNGANNFSGLKAEVINEDCGATIASIKSVRLLMNTGKWVPLGEGGGKVFSIQHGDPNISIRWEDKDTLKIDCRDCKDEDIFLKVVKKNFTNIAYALQVQEK
jgi:hypothetical protein